MFSTKLTLVNVVMVSSIGMSYAAEYQEIEHQEFERIEVRANRSDITTEITEHTQKLIEMPGAMGDPLKAVYALPGVVAAAGSVSSPAVRGSSPKDNLFEVDFMPAGYIFHDFGNSIFNPNIIQDFRLHSAAFGTGFSNATGAVFDIALRKPRKQAIETKLDVSLLNSGLLVEGQLTENSAFYLTARKNMLPYWLDRDSFEDDDIILNDEPDDHDYQAKWAWDINENNVLTVSLTGAEDSAGATFNDKNFEVLAQQPELLGDAIFINDFHSQGIIWDHYAKNFTLKVGLGALSKNEKTSFGVTANHKGYFDNMSHQQLSYKAHLNYRLSPLQSIQLDAGFYDTEYHLNYDKIQLICSEFIPDCSRMRGDRIQNNSKLKADHAFIGLNHTWQVSEKIQTQLGLQAQQNKYTDESFILPRLSIDYYLSDDSTITVKYGHYNRMQDIDKIAPQLGNPKLKSQTAKHSSLTFSQYLEDEWSWSVSSYYKTMDNLPKIHWYTADELYTNEIEGEAYGIDFLVNKNLTDDWYGWFSFSYSKSERTDTKRDITSDFYADTPIILNLVLSYEINDLWKAGINLTSRSGNAYTPVTGVYVNEPDNPVKYTAEYGVPNSKRFDNHYRLDLSVTRITKFWGLEGLIKFEIINAFAAEHPVAQELAYDYIVADGDVFWVDTIDGDDGVIWVDTIDGDDSDMIPSIGFSVKF
ncbi:MAG: TonB-dependent receptor [Colwellia sp.]|nr:TonB-dependent receptor [Colwellia sp.]